MATGTIPAAAVPVLRVHIFSLAAVRVMSSTVPCPAVSSAAVVANRPVSDSLYLGPDSYRLSHSWSQNDPFCVQHLSGQGTCRCSAQMLSACGAGTPLCWCLCILSELYQKGLGCLHNLLFKPLTCQRSLLCTHATLALFFAALSNWALEQGMLMF